MTCAVLFAKNPVPGEVKTRLQSHLRATEAASLYAAFLRDSVAILRASSAKRRVVAYAPADAEGPLRAALGDTGDVDFLPQPEGHLGERMAGLFRRVFDDGAGRVLVVGSDSPSLPTSRLDEALEQLRDADVVLGPSVDGGYYLVGLRESAFTAAAPKMFGDLEWSSGSELEQTVAGLPDGLRLRMLPPWYDVDLPREAAFLRAHLGALERAGETAAPNSLAVLRQLDLPPVDTGPTSP